MDEVVMNEWATQDLHTVDLPETKCWCLFIIIGLAKVIFFKNYFQLLAGLFV